MDAVFALAEFRVGESPITPVEKIDALNSSVDTLAGAFGERLIDLCGQSPPKSLDDHVELQNVVVDSFRAYVQAETLLTLGQQWPLLRAIVEDQVRTVDGYMEASARDFHGLKEALLHFKEQVQNSMSGYSQEMFTATNQTAAAVVNLRESADQQVSDLKAYVDSQSNDMKATFLRDAELIRRTISLRHEDGQWAAKNLEKRMLATFTEEQRRNLSIAEEVATASRALTDESLQVQRNLINDLSAQVQNCKDAHIALATDLEAARSASEERSHEICRSIEQCVRTTGCRSDEIMGEVKTATASAKKALAASDSMLELVDKRLHKCIHAASNALREQISTCVKDFTENQGSKDLQTGLQARLSKEVLSLEVQKLLDRALLKLQAVSDDIAYRSSNLMSKHASAEAPLATATLPPLRTAGERGPDHAGFRGR